MEIDDLIKLPYHVVDKRIQSFVVVHGGSHYDFWFVEEV